MSVSLDTQCMTDVQSSMGAIARHTEIFLASYLWAKEAIDALEAEGNSAIAAILATGKPATERPRDLVGLRAAI